MKYYIKSMIEDFPHRIGTTSIPWTDKLFKVNDNSKLLDEERKSTFHTFVMKAMFLCKRARPDIEPAVSFLATRTASPNEDDWNKLLKVLSFLNSTIDDVLKIAADEFTKLHWYIDASFAVHPDMKSHTGSIFTLGYGAIISASTKQKVNSRSSTEAELNGVDDRISKVLWTKRFIESQGHKVQLNVIYQDNTSTIKLQENGKASCGKRTRHFDIKLFYITDLIGRDEVQVEYCPTDMMIADYRTKRTTGRKFKMFLMNL